MGGGFAVHRSESSLSIGQEPIPGAAPDAHDDEIGYENGGMGFRLMGVLLICALLWLGASMLGLKHGFMLIVAPSTRR